MVAADDGPWLPLAVSTTYAAVVGDVRTNGNCPIEPGTMVLSVTAGRAVQLRPVKPGERLSISTAVMPDLTGAPCAVAGDPKLITASKPSPAAGGKDRHPRTAIGYDEANLYLVVVDGRQKGLSDGMTLAELAALMQRLGCADALNLDGGGSSTMWLDGKVVNTPSDGRERPVGNALILVRQPPPSPPEAADR